MLRNGDVLLMTARHARIAIENPVPNRRATDLIVKNGARNDRPEQDLGYSIREGSDKARMLSKKFHTALIVWLISSVWPWGASPAAEGPKFRADEWVTECDSRPGPGPPDCSITVPFWQTRGGPKGSFALVVMLQTGNMAIVGQPFPNRAVLRVDKNPPIECKQARYCVFPSIPALAVLNQLKIGSLVLIDVYTEKGEFSFSLTPKGFQAGIAKIRAWGYRTD